MTLLPSLFLSLFPSNAASMPESPPTRGHGGPSNAASGDEPETQPLDPEDRVVMDKPLVTGTVVHDCSIGMVVIHTQQCHLLDSMHFHPTHDSWNRVYLKQVVKKRSANSDADGQPASQAARLQDGSDSAAAAPTAPARSLPWQWPPPSWPTPSLPMPENQQ